MRITEIINHNAGEGFKLVRVQFQVEGHSVEAEFFIGPKGEVQAHKNAKYGLAHQFEAILRTGLPALMNLENSENKPKV